MSSTHTLDPRESKIVILGYQAVGKSSILSRYVKNTYSDMEESTIGAAFYSKTHRSDAGRTHRFQLWDTAGQERYAGLAPMYYRKSDAIIVVYDCTWKSTLKEAKRWIREVKNYEPSAIVALVANKCDLIENTPRPVIADSVDIFCKASAKKNVGISKLFEDIANLLDKKKENENSSPRRIELTPKKRNYYCCD
jgi:Ras-related protein Rab-5C